MTTSKKYPQQEEESFAPSACEPAATYGASINDLSKTLPEELEQEAPPCQFTVKEMNAILDRAEADIKAGNTISADEMKRRVLNRYL